jgi:hypothetical protein
MRPEKRTDRRNADPCPYGYDCSKGQLCKKNHRHLPVCKNEKDTANICKDTHCVYCHAHDCEGHQAFEGKRAADVGARKDKIADRIAEQARKDPELLARLLAKLTTA